MRFDHDRLRRVRLDLGLSQAEAAAAVGVDVRTWRRYESGAVNGRGGFTVRRAGRRALLARMSAEFGVDEPAWLIADAGSDATADARRHGGSTAPPPTAPPPVAPPPVASRAAPPVASRAAPLPRGLQHPLPRARHFTGRAALLARVADWLAAPTPSERIIALIGLGGAGKTSLVERAIRAREERAPDAAIWGWSFYDDPRVEALLAALCAALDLPVDPPGSAPRRICEALVDRGSCALVLDGLELAQSLGDAARARGECTDPALRRLLRGLVRGVGGARALVTSRLPLTDLDGWHGEGYAPIALEGLDEAASVALLERWGAIGQVDELRRLARAAGGHALTLAMTGAWLDTFADGRASAAAAIPDPAPLADLDPRARRLDAVLRAYATALEPRDRALLCRLSLFEHGVDAATLAALTGEPTAAGALHGLDAAALDARLRRLARQGLAHRLGTGARWSSHPMLRARFRQLDDPPISAIRAVAARHLHARAPWVAPDPAGQPGPAGEAPVHEHAEALIRAMIAAGRVEAARGIYQRTLGGWSHLGLRLGQTGRLLRLLGLFAAEGTPETLRPALPAPARLDLAYQWSLTASAAGDLPLARRAIAVAGRIAASPGRMPFLPRARAYLAWLADDLPVARAEAQVAVHAARSSHSGWHQARAEALAGAIAHAAGDAPAAAAHFARARSVDDEGLVARRGVWEADWLRQTGEASRALARLTRNIAVCEARGWPAHTALARLARVDAALAAGEPALARSTWEAVRPAIGGTGEFEVRLRALAAEADLLDAEGQPTAGSARRARGRLLAEDGGFGWALRRLAARSTRSANG